MQKRIQNYKDPNRDLEQEVTKGQRQAWEGWGIMTNRYEKHFIELLNLDFSVHFIIFFHPHRMLQNGNSRKSQLYRLSVESKSKVQSVLLYTCFENTVDTLGNSVSIFYFFLHGFGHDKFQMSKENLAQVKGAVQDRTDMHTPQTSGDDFTIFQTLFTNICSVFITAASCNGYRSLIFK